MINYSKTTFLICVLSTYFPIAVHSKNSKDKLAVQSHDRSLLEFSTVLTGPNEIPNGSCLTYTGTVTGPFNDQNRLNYFWEVFDEYSFVFGERLDNGGFEANSGPEGTLSTDTLTFDLCCENNIVIGDDGSSMEQQADVYMIMDDFAGSYESNRLPVECVVNGGGYGDPHFKTLSGYKFDYHGQCDLLLLQSAQFGSGLGLDLHIRTRIRRGFSYIISTALRIGDDILEVTGNDVFYFNGVAGEIPKTMSGYMVNYDHPDKKKHQFTVLLGNGQSIYIHSFKYLVSVDFHSEGTNDQLKDSVGLLGSFETGSMLARDGITILEDHNAFGQEWQVLHTEPMLFQSIQAPQHPEVCVLPPLQEKDHRHLRQSITEQAAEKACADWGDDKESCIFDVLATGDIEIAEAGAY